MPEIAEVETVRRTLERVLLGKKITATEFVDDKIVLGKRPPSDFNHVTEQGKVTAVKRKGKYWWIEFERGPMLFGHLGMAGWIREIGAATIRLKEHGKKPMDDENGHPRFLKMMLTAEDGKRIAFTDGRRLSRLWLADSAQKIKGVAQLGPDMYLEPYSPEKLHEILSKRSAPIKALLLNQKLFAGIGNWIADEVCYQARISPKRLAKDLTKAEVKRLLAAIKSVLTIAIEAGADEKKYPATWMFHGRWGGKRGAKTMQGFEVIREKVGGRTTAWVPKLQK